MTEDAALDSYQNVLFSLARFRELTGANPAHITVVGHAFKRRRFEQLHRLALRWPRTRFAYEGVPLGNEADEREGTNNRGCGTYPVWRMQCHTTIHKPQLNTMILRFHIAILKIKQTR